MNTNTQWIEDKTNSNNIKKNDNNNNNNNNNNRNNNNKQKQKQKILNRRTRSKKGDEKIHPIVLLINSL